MTEKRFVKGYHTIRDIKENNAYDFQVNIICDLLNELDEKWIGELSLCETLQQDLQRVEAENEQLQSKNKGLQSELQIFKEDVTHSNLQINKLTDEKEQLKKQLRNSVKQIRKDTDTIFELEEKNKELKGEVAHYKLILMSLEEQAKRISSIRSCKND